MVHPCTFLRLVKFPSYGLRPRELRGSMPGTKKVLICYHDRCFDGTSSAAFFMRWYRDAFEPHAEFAFHGLLHSARQLYEESMFDGDENVIVDFKYSSSPRLTWWFDHHQSAFLSEADAAHFRRDTSGRKFYYPEFRSCTKLISHIASTKFGFRAPDLDDLVQWADLIDGAQYPDARAAVEMKDPATQITLVIEGASDSGLIAKLIPQFATMSLQDIAAQPDIQRNFELLYSQHLKWMELIRKRADLKSGVLFFDVASENLEGFNKFIPYYLFPDAHYSISISQSLTRIKIAVGSSPWNAAANPANLASICERYGGGGHSKVAAISLPPGDLDEARRVAREIAQELRSTFDETPAR
jgi:hypothetical protein